VWKINDKVSAVVNDYKNSIMNGDEGKIINVAPTGVKVKFKHITVTFTFNDDIDKINHSFATTVHKSQGSEWPYVLLYISGMSDFITNNIIYTAASRAKKRLWIISKRSVLEKCIQAVMEPRLDNLARKINELYSSI
jgi:exodeoxyribonuclease V alpha subunit